MVQQLYGGLGDFVSQLSHGAMTFLPSDNMVLGPVEVPCSGVDPSYGAYNLATQCGDAERAAVMSLAQHAAQGVRLAAPSPLPPLFLLPSSPPLSLFPSPPPPVLVPLSSLPPLKK